MTVTVLDSTDLPAILADAGVELEAAPAASDATNKPADDASDKAGLTDAEQHEDPDDVEGEDGLTPRQKRELTEKMQKAIGKKHRQRMEAEEFAAAQYSERKLAEERAARLERELAELRSKSAPQPAPKAPEKPQRENFQTEEEYVDAMIQFGVDQRLREKEEQDARARAEREREQLIEAAKGRIARALELVPDYAEVTGAVDLEVPPAIAGYMQKSDMFAELGYHLAKNPDLLLSLTKLPPDEQLVKIGKIESTLQPFEPKAAPNDSKSSKEVPNGKASKPAPSADTGNIPSKPRGNAAPVITPLDAAGSAGATKDSKDMNIREAIEDFSKRNRVNLGMRKRH
ncbi:hypothetical protein [Burkholderia metallica]|uniref:hypothetical protein n=1 Tax=Burkholderia metallica TaxID=488729 RepID=UPI001CF591A0|nr:hypothetical protein [Burkholderia metallica]MCA8018080.1 hypothetical protein [Burkholderia metallica]